MIDFISGMLPENVFIQSIRIVDNNEVVMYAGYLDDDEKDKLSSMIKRHYGKNITFIYSRDATADLTMKTSNKTLQGRHTRSPLLSLHLVFIFQLLFSFLKSSRVCPPELCVRKWEQE